MVVHNKARPELMADTGKRPSDTDAASKRSERFFFENPIERLKADLQGFVDAGVNRSPAVQWGVHLFEKYYERGKA